jgi:hypothetical protein
MTLLREDLLAGRRIVLGGGVSDAVAKLLVGLGASVQRLDGAAGGDPRAVGDVPAVGDPLPAPVDGDDASPHAMVHDASSAFARGGEAGLAAALQDAWDAVAAVAGQVMIPAGGGGKVVLIAPRAGAGRYADAARAGLENLARTLSIEWARYGIATTAITPGSAAREEDVATLVAFLLSTAGDYFSGCRFALGALG